MILRSIGDLNGVNIGGVNVNNLRYAADSVLIAESEEQLQSLLDNATTESEVKGLDLNTKKTECMVTTKKSETPICRLTSKGEGIQQVDVFRYLGYTMTSNGKCLTEVKKRIAIAKDAFNRMRTIMKNRCTALDTRIRVLKTDLWSVLLHGCESWTIDKETRRRIEAAEMWFLR